MNAERLLTLYDRVADAAGAIPRLRRFVLDLAVRGKLVEQHPDDEPASELLRRIRATKATLLTAGEIKKLEPASAGVEPPFEVPPNWAWTRLGAIAGYVQRGKSPRYADGKGLPVVSQKCVQWSGLDLDVAKQVTPESLLKYETTRFLRDGDLLWNSTGTGTIGRVIRLSGPLPKLVCDSHVTVVRCIEVDSEYLRTWLRTDHVYGVIEERAAGSTNQVELTAQMAKNQAVPLPPLAEQHRIVAKVEELMGLLDELETVRSSRETTRDRLTASAFARLTAPDMSPEDFSAHAKFAFNALPELSARPDQIKSLRQTILNLAVRGKLVEQDPSDEPASELLARVGSEQMSQRIAPRPRQPGAHGETGLDTELPDGWLWTTLSEISRQLHYGYTASAIKTETDVRLLRISDIQDDHVEWSRVPGCEIDPETVSKYTLEPGDLLIARTGGTIGKTFLVSEVPVKAVFASYLIRVQPARVLHAPYVKLFCGSDLYWDQLRKGSRGGGQPNVNGKTLGRMNVPLPPLAEQRRIVALAEGLMSLCDRLENALSTADTTKQRLLEAVLHEALAEGHHGREVA